MVTILLMDSSLNARPKQFQCCVLKTCTIRSCVDKFFASVQRHLSGNFFYLESGNPDFCGTENYLKSYILC